MEWIKRRTFEYSLRRARRKKKKRVKDPKLDGSSFLLLHSSESTHLPAPLKVFIDELKRSGKQVQCVLFVPDADKESPDEHTLCLSKKDSTWYDKPSADKLQIILDKSWDVLIALDDEIPRAFRYIITLAGAQMKVSIATSDEVDLVVDVEEHLPLEDRIEEVKSVLQTVSTVLE